MANIARKAALSVDIFGTTLTVTFSNGKDLSVDVTTLASEIQKQALLHGVKQKLVDAAAIARNMETGKSASIDDKYNAVKDVFDRLTHPTEPSWNKGRAEKGETTGGAGSALVIRALMKMTGRDESYTKQWFSNKSKEERAALKKNPRVLAIMAELQAATVVGGINTDDMLSELGSNEPETIVEAIEEVQSDEPAPAPTKSPRGRNKKAEAAHA
jgi:hypothetical protein